MTWAMRDKILREASIQKMRAIRLRDFGDEEERRDALLLFEQSADNELAALAMIQTPTKLDEIRARSEACGLYFCANQTAFAHEQWKLLPEEARSELGERDENLLACMKYLDARERLTCEHAQRPFGSMTSGWKTLLDRALARCAVHKS
jgi:hypothetical protein